MIWDRDYMRRRRASEDDADTEPSPPAEPFNIFAGLPLEELPAVKRAQPGISERPGAVEDAPPKKIIHEEMPLNRLFARHPRLLVYILIAAVALVLGILFGMKMASQ